MTYAIESQKPRSHKVILCTIEARELAKIFTLDSGSQYYRDVNHFVSGVSDAGTALVAGSLPLSAGQYYFDKTARRLYVRTIDSSNPKTRDLAVKFKFFFSSSGHNLPFDVSTGEHVHWDSRLSGTGAIKQALDDENTGVVVESQSTITLINSDGYFDEIFDTLIWENQSCEFWSWITSTPVSQAQKLFSGTVEEKTYDSDKVSFKLKDFTFKLRDKLSLNLFSDSDGDLSDSDLNKPKRRLVGKLKQAQCVGTQKILGGYTKSVTCVGVAGDSFVTFGSSQLGEIFPGDEIEITLPDGTTEKISLDSITSSTVYATSSALDFGFSVSSFVIIPERATRKRNRNWFIAGHKLYEPTATIASIEAGNRFTVDSTDGFFAGDKVEINGDISTVRRVSGTKLITNQVISPLPAVNDVFTRPAISSVYWGEKELLSGRDFTYTNTTEAKLSIDPLAEFYLAPERGLGGTNLTFTNGSSSVTSSSTSLDLRTVLRPRDFIRSSSLTDATWYEIAQVDQFSLKLVTNFSGSTGAISALYKNVDFIDDDAVILVDCYGLEHGGEWIKTAADYVKFSLENDAGLTQIDTAAFSKANALCDYTLSLPLPARPGDALPNIRDAISQVNSSVFGSLFTTSSFLLSYSILNSAKPASLATVKDDDIIGFSVEARNKIINELIVNYSPFVDKSTGDDSFEVYEYTNTKVNQLIGIQNKAEITVYLYHESEAQIVGQRYAFFNSLSRSRVRLKAPLAFSQYSLNDKIYLNLDRLYKRYGGRDRLKVGAISSIAKDGFGVEIELDDLGNIFNRVPAISPSTQAIYSAASGEEVAKYGFILDNDTETPDASTEDELGNNLIG